MTVSRNAGKFAVRYFSLFLCIILTIGVSLSILKQDVSADGTVTCGVSQVVDGDHVIIYINSWGFDSNISSIAVVLDVNHSVDSLYEPWGSNSSLKNYSVTGSGNQISASVVPGEWVALEIGSTNISDLSVSVSSYTLIYASTPTPTPSETTAATTQATQATTKPTQATQATTQATQATTQATQATTQATVAQTAAPAQTKADNSGGNVAPAGGDAPAPSDTTAQTETTAATGTSETTETTEPTETAEADALTADTAQETVMAVVGEVQEGETYDQTVVLDETHEDGSPVVMGLNSKTQEELSVEKAKKQLMTASFWIVLVVLLAGASYARYKYLKKKGYKGSEIAINFIPGTSDLIYAIGYHFNLPGKSKEVVPAESSDSHASFNTASAMKELKKMESTDVKVSTAKTPSVPHKRPKELSVNHAAAVAAAKTAQDAPKTKTSTPSTPSVPHKRPKELSVNHAAAVAAAKTAQDTPKTNTARPSVTATSGSSLGNEAARAARERAEAAKEQLRMRAEARRSKIEEVKKEELQQRPPIKRPASLSVNHAAAAAAATAKENTTRSDADVEPTNSPFKPLDRSAEREIYSTPGLRPRKSAEDHQRMAAGANQLGKGIGAQRPEAPYSKNGRAPMWAAPGTGRINPFKPSATAESASAPKAETQSSSAAQPANTAEHASIADQTTHRSAFFDRAEKARAFTPAKEGRDSRVGDMTRPSGKGKAPHAPTVGMSLEGKDSSILNNGTAPTATEPLPGFKPIDPNK